MTKAVFANSGEDVGKLQADEDEDETIDGKGEGIPDGPGLHSYFGGEELGALAAEVKAAGDDGEDSGSARGFGGEIGGVGSEDADDDFDGPVVDAALEPFDN